MDLLTNANVNKSIIAWDELQIQGIHTVWKTSCYCLSTELLAATAAGVGTETHMHVS